MSERKHNFNAGPAALPREVLEIAQRNLVDHEGMGLSLLEMSHRTPAFEAIIAEAKATLAELYDLPETHEVMFLQGGASLQFAMAPMNFGGHGAYIDTGTWSTKAFTEGQNLGPAWRIWTDEDNAYRRVPAPDEALSAPDDARFLHYTSNNTIRGTQFHHLPAVAGRDLPLICDMSSDFLSRPIDVGAHALIYAGAQKNAGPSGVTILLIDRRWSRRFDGLPHTPRILRYATQAAKDSMFNTPNTFGIYMVGLVAKWVKANGGLSAMHALARAKTDKLYGLIDGDDRYTGCAERASRSLMNVTFRMKSPEQELAVRQAAEAAGIMGIKGHRSVGGLRASVYNAVPMAAMDALVELLRGFRG